ncbi:hypothetical protein [Streptomyces sp. NPDC059918]|uniref:hypothetical protein n=1 Tax=unclassified Streptomyces TaxID=2593676 RepID=UPI003651DA3B
MTDVSGALARLGDPPAAWREEVAVGIADDLARSLGGVVDWDGEADEEWMSVLVQDSRVAMVSTALRLVVAGERVVGHLQIRTPGVSVIAVPSFDAPAMRCDVAVLARVFGGEGKFGELDPEAFSANDLWFATV